MVFSLTSRQFGVAAVVGIVVRENLWYDLKIKSRMKLQYAPKSLGWRPVGQPKEYTKQAAQHHVLCRLLEITVKLKIYLQLFEIYCLFDSAIKIIALLFWISIWILDKNSCFWVE